VIADKLIKPKPMSCDTRRQEAISTDFTLARRRRRLWDVTSASFPKQASAVPEHGKSRAQEDGPDSSARLKWRSSSPSSHTRGARIAGAKTSITSDRRRRDRHQQMRWTIALPTLLGARSATPRSRCRSSPHHQAKVDSNSNLKKKIETQVAIASPRRGVGEVQQDAARIGRLALTFQRLAMKSWRVIRTELGLSATTSSRRATLDLTA